MDKKYKLVGVRFYNLEDENFFRDSQNKIEQ